MIIVLAAAGEGLLSSQLVSVGRQKTLESATVRRGPTPQEWGNKPEQVAGECLKLDPRLLRVST